MSQDKCKRCGKCCFVKLNIMGWIVPTKQTCPHLKMDEQKKFYCDVYEKRFEVTSWCHPIEDAIKECSVPNDCGYVIGTDYKSKLKENININPEN